MISALKEEYLLQPLPSVPDWFIDELSKVATRDGRPVFRIADGLRTTHFRNGKQTIKYPIQHPAYFKEVVRTRFRRIYKDRSLGQKTYTSWDDAQKDNTPGLRPEIDMGLTSLGVHGIGRPCWVVEVYISPEETDFNTWQASRYGMLEKNGIAQKVDILGEYPREGWYTACFNVVDDEGNAISPNQRTIDECKRRWRSLHQESESFEQAVQGSNEAMELFEEKKLKEMNENFVQWGGIVAKNTVNAGVTGKPILKEFSAVN